MSPRSASVNEELRRRSRQRLLEAAVELVSEKGYEATTIADIADRAGSARGLISYYFPGKRQLVQSAVHRLMQEDGWLAGGGKQKGVVTHSSGASVVLAASHGGGRSGRDGCRICRG